MTGEGDRFDDGRVSVSMTGEGATIGGEVKGKRDSGRKGAGKKVKSDRVGELRLRLAAFHENPSPLLTPPVSILQPPLLTFYP